MIKINEFKDTQIIERHLYGKSREHVIVMVLDPDEAENIADALGPNDGAHKELYEAAAEARRLDEEER